MQQPLDTATTDDFTRDGTTVRHTAALAQADLRTVLQLCAAGRLRCSEKTQRPSVATVGAVAAALTSGDAYPDEAIAAFAWPLLLQAGGLAELAGGRLQLTARGRTALSARAPETLRHLWRRWVSSGVIDEMSRVEEIKGQRSPRALSAVKPRRKAVAEAMAWCEPGQWVPVDELFSRMRRSEVLTVARDLWKLYLVDREYGSLGYLGHHDWSIVEGRYVLCLLFEYAGTLGLFDLAYTDAAGARDDYRGNWGADDLDRLSRYDGLIAVRLNELGAYVLGQSPTYEPAGGTDVGVGRVLKVLPNLDVVVTGELRPADHLVLDAFSDRGSDRVWSLSPRSLLAAVDAGRQLDEIERFLRDRAHNDIPPTVTTLLDDVRARAGRLRSLGVVHMVACADPAVAALLVNDRRLRTLCYAVGDRHVAVPLEHEAAFRAGVRVLGYVLPADVSGPLST